MKSFVLLSLLLIGCSPVFSADKAKQFKVIDLAALAKGTPDCEANLTTFVNQMVWIDDQHLIALLINNCHSRESKKWKSDRELVLIELNGHARSIRRDDVFRVFRGPNGTVLTNGNRIEILNTELRTKQTIKCSKDCAVFISSSLSDGSDFAICSITSSVENCHFYRGQPVAQIQQRTWSISISNKTYRNPYKAAQLPEAIKAAGYWRTAWQVNPLETWYFDKQGILTSWNVNGVTGPVSKAEWTPAHSECSGELSISEPRRFLAICVGTHFYTDGALDGIFGYSRIALFDVTSKRIIARIDGPSYTSAALSPNGKLISVVHDNKARLYRVN